MKAKNIVIRFAEFFSVLRIDEKPLFKCLSGFTTYWDQEPTNAGHRYHPVSTLVKNL